MCHKNSPVKRCDHKTFFKSLKKTNVTLFQKCPENLLRRETRPINLLQLDKTLYYLAL